ncbi:MAG: RTX toxin [Ahniella sp.]|nr:RTX toxin [Ahniella sp.]
MTATLLLPMWVAAQSGTWEDLGPGPATGGQVEGITNGEVVGAVNALAAHPSNADILYAGAVNGGIWRTNNATNASPTWTRLTDNLASLSIGALEFDPLDATRQTLLAGSARTSSLGSIGGAQIGLLRTTNGGTTWTVLAGTGVTLAGRQVRGVAARGAILVAATNGGVFRSSDTGATFVEISGGAGTGLPVGNTTDLTADPSNQAVLYTAVVLVGSAAGLYRSADTGATWTRVSNATMDTAMNGATRARMVVGSSSQTYVAVIRSGRLSNVFRSPDGTSGWVDMGVPTTTEAGGIAIGAHAGGQGSIHFSMAADPANVNVVYLAGDRQPYFGGRQQLQSVLPELDWRQRLQWSGVSRRIGGAPVWRPLTHNGTANNSSPHADSRDMAFDANGNLLESDDGGVYRRTQPNLTSGVWQSVNGSLQTTEYHSLAYDSFSDRVIGGAQDVGTPEEDQIAIKRFRSVSTADGGDVTVNDVGATTVSTRYNSFQNLGAFRRRTLNASNAVQSTAFPALTPTDGNSMTAQFYTPIISNAVNGDRLIFGGNNGVFESATRGDTITLVSTLRINQIVGSPMIYGIPGNEDLLFFGSTTGTHLRTAAAGPVSALATLPATVVDVAMDPSVNPVGGDSGNGRLFAMTSAQVFRSTTSGASYSDITGNLITGFAPGTLRAMVFLPNADAALVVATDRGIFISRASGGFSAWLPLGTGFPNVPVFELDYDLADDVLVAGSMGRGAWKLVGPLSAVSLFSNGFE